MLVVYHSTITSVFSVVLPLTKTRATGILKGKQIHFWISGQYSLKKQRTNGVAYDPKSSPGVQLNEVSYFEKCFKVNINIYRTIEENVVTPVYKSRMRYNETMHLNLHQQQLSYISNFKAYAQKYQCGTCERHFKVLSNTKKHQKLCKERTHFKFPGGVYAPTKNHLR